MGRKALSINNLSAGFESTISMKHWLMALAITSLCKSVDIFTVRVLTDVVHYLYMKMMVLIRPSSPDPSLVNSIPDVLMTLFPRLLFCPLLASHLLMDCLFQDLYLGFVLIS